MKKKVLLIISIMVLPLLAKQPVIKPGLILSGKDTLTTIYKRGFDFISQKVCSTTVDYPGCHQHFFIIPFADPHLHYDIGVNGGVGINMGKLNLDSIKSAPPDSVFEKHRGRCDSIPPDSLSSRVGNCYVLKTGRDKRVDIIHYAKIKILGFDVIDSANRIVEMRFLWVVNRNGWKDLTSSNLDTFDLTTPVSVNSSLVAVKKRLSTPRVFKVVGDRFVVPRELVGSGARLTVYDLRGRRVGVVECGVGKRMVELNGMTRGIKVLRNE